MKRLIGLIVGLMLMLALRSASAIEPYLTLKVDHGDGSYAIAEGYLDHSFDAVWVQEIDYLDKPQVAWDYSGTKYSNLALGYPAYIWAGNHIVDGTPYDLIIQSIGSAQIVGKKPDGTVVFNQTLSPGQTFTWTFFALHATTAQWRTRGYRFDITPVPEPSSIVVLVGAMISLLVYRRRR